ncbi:hypothetical protein A2397_04275 [Candidatus Amesbacteria bacterium RIFOXYB1_FULL_44_23]|uniref:Uncharacterized protein n=1 Tax=Candidatus Amesbacteria bacterium RIFOXYB1_FULL_44_23 TaxID=1797263 RepID=A0A1F4ZS27_9BACT|nr:MAG: hypothetical protein A2397_04275 [Candidatus Amesbacteria bacterium RIFOXYB1_FULL_44_23]
MHQNSSGNSLIIFLLVLVAAIPVSTYFFVRGRQALSTGNIDSVKELPENTLTSTLKEIVYFDKEQQKEIRYWAFDTENHGQESLFNCYLLLTPKGGEDKFFGFSKNYSLRDCNKLGDTRANYECRISNAMSKFQNAESSKIWNKIPAGGNLLVAVSRFYTEQTISSQSFFNQNRLSDIHTLTPVCKTSTGARVKQIISFP